MTVSLKLLKPTTARLSSMSLDKMINSKKNLAKPSPKLWPNDHQPEFADFDDQGLPILSINHPILHTLESCSNITDFNQIHAQLIVSGLFQHPLAAGRVVKKLCTCLNSVFLAAFVFDSIEQPDAFLCNTIINGYVNLNDTVGALNFYYERMVAKWVLPNHYTFPLLVKVCAVIGSVREGQKAHALVFKCGFELDLFVRNSLMHMYSICGRICDAREVFDLGSVLDLVSWNSMIDGYVKNREVGAARKLFDQMPERDIFSWNSMIAGYVEIGDMMAARELFEIMSFSDVFSWNCMIDGYARIGNVSMARELFDRMTVRTVVSWNTMLALYVRYKDYSECLRLFDKMIGGEARPNDASLVSVLTACAYLGRLDRGKWVHSYIQTNRIKSDVLLWTALLTMYAKCGAIDLARYIFDEMPNKNVVSWNSMIMGYGMHGHGEKALELFLEMDKRGPMPNDATFVCVLSACTHAGMVLEGWWYFDLMRRVFKVEPKVEHYGCMVDLLGRAGLMKDSEELIRKIPIEAGPASWGALLSACRTHSNSELGEMVAKRLTELEPVDIGPYVLLSNIYAAEGKWDDVDNVRKMMKEKRIQKVAGSSLIHLEELKSESSMENSGSLHRRSMLYSMLSEMGMRMKLCQ
ncbi:PPR domain-containing protein/PPR_2 domain-containing protein [Cephalotus follicularis]|uniref:PPR domain-containing protein/PPR_2 domain-containing protein n=1 Tax=Cephalotus follicularis TaxID=3775 RepID=A0A1Q3B2T4_CEPFO|nr:PPR domain-containing protein/PPR_2 domain-containing protein [Cephalotus follicularis]